MPQPSTITLTLNPIDLTRPKFQSPFTFKGDTLSIDTAALTGEPLPRKYPSEEYGKMILSLDGPLGYLCFLFLGFGGPYLGLGMICTLPDSA